MDPITIASGSVSLNLAQIEQAASVSVMKKSMDFSESGALALVQDLMMLNPSIGQNLNITA